MVARLLGMSEFPQPADAADALAIAICHIHTAQTLTLQGAGAMKALFLAMMLAAVTVAARAEARRAGIGPLLPVHFSNPGLTPAQWTLEFHPDGNRPFPFRARQRGRQMTPSKSRRPISIATCR